MVVPLAWLWTDDLVARLADAGLVDERLEVLRQHPIAIAIPAPRTGGHEDDAPA